MALYLVLSACLLCYLFYRHILYPGFLSPLSKIPAAHPTAPYLPTWYWWRQRIGYESRTIFAAHQAHGAIVRLAPNELSVASLDGLRRIYIGGFERSDWFLQFLNYDGTRNLLTLDGKAHATRKRILSHIYSKSYLLSSADFQVLAGIILFDRLLPGLESAARGEVGVDVLGLSHVVGAEFMSAYGLGVQNSLDLVREGKEEERAEYLLNARRKLKNLKGNTQAARNLEDQCSALCRQAEISLASASDEKNTNQKASEPTTTYPVVYAQLSNAIPEKEGITSPEETFRFATSEILDHTEASREGIGITLNYAMHELSQHPALQSALRRELAPVLPAFSPTNPVPLSTSTLRELEGLPLLDSILAETLRLYPASPGPQRRVVPKDGAVIDGYAIPAGVIIGVSPYSMHRYESAYPDANVWKPERWTASQDSKEAQIEHDGRDLEKSTVQDQPRQWFCTFGRGGRMCSGNHFALLVMKLVLATIYANFTTTIEDDEGIEPEDGMMGCPVGEKLILKFNRIAAEA